VEEGGQVGVGTSHGIGVGGVVVVREGASADVGYVEVGTGEAGEGEVSGGEFFPGLANKWDALFVFHFGGTLAKEEYPAWGGAGGEDWGAESWTSGTVHGLSAMAIRLQIIPNPITIMSSSIPFFTTIKLTSKKDKEPNTIYLHKASITLSP
jgi:hypothetical protein